MLKGYFEMQPIEGMSFKPVGANLHVTTNTSMLNQQENFLIFFPRETSMFTSTNTMKFPKKN